MGPSYTFTPFFSFNFPSTSKEGKLTSFLSIYFYLLSFYFPINQMKADVFPFNEINFWIFNETSFLVVPVFIFWCIQNKINIFVYLIFLIKRISNLYHVEFVLLTNRIIYYFGNFPFLGYLNTAPNYNISGSYT